MDRMTATRKTQPRVKRPPAAKKAERTRLSSVATAIRLLKTFTEEEEELGVIALAQKLGVAKSTVHRLAVTLVSEGLLEQDPRTDVPSRDLIPITKQRQSPYLYTDAEVEALLAACRRLHTRGVRLTAYTLFGLLAATGLRVGEAIALDRTDVDARQACLIVRHGKFNKSREVPLHPTTMEALRTYGQHRDAAHPRPRSPSFFLTIHGTRPHVQNVWQTFDRVRRLAGLARGPRAPRIHDLRHSFAMDTVLRWSRQHLDLHARLPLLSTYLGHVGPSSTYWYLTATPALLELAAQRVEPWRGAQP